VKIGIGHTTLATADHTIPDPREVGRYAEDAGLDSLWGSDHLAWGTPILDSTLMLTAAAAVTRRLEVGFAVMQLALRPLAWAAKQIGTLQTISGGRVQLGVGIGGFPEDEWAAAGVPIRQRARRTDEALRALPALLRGDLVELPGANGVPTAKIALSPAAPMPKVWIGGDSPAALRRAAQLGDAWLPALMPLEQLRAGRQILREQSERAGRPMPAIGVSMFAALESHLGGMSHQELAGMCARDFGYAPERADAAVLSGKPAQVAERLAAFAEQGVEQAVIVPFGGEWQRQCDLLAEAKALL
jgi:alkanesulfonate monooxygenase SsuD/methylene tetrahydromethanopterin reductase-like flavin-dependent oxidoreductase (luciferase family)